MTDAADTFYSGAVVRQVAAPHLLLQHIDRVRAFWTPERIAEATARHFPPPQATAIRPAQARQGAGGGLGFGPMTLSVVADMTAAPYSAVGSFVYTLNGQAYRATAALCSPASNPCQNTIVTAAHLVLPGGVASLNMAFVPSGTTAAIPVTKYVVPASYGPTNPLPLDVALCQLAGNAPAANVPIQFGSAATVFNSVQILGYPQTAVGAFGFDGQFLWSSTTTLPLDNFGQDASILYGTSVMSAGADGGPWVISNNNVFTLVGVSGTHVANVWSSANLASWIGSLYTNLVSGGTPIVANVSEPLGVSPVSVLFANNTLYCSSETTLVQASRGQLTIQSQSFFSDVHSGYTDTTLAINNGQIYVGISDAVVALSGAQQIVYRGTTNGGSVPLSIAFDKVGNIIAGGGGSLSVFKPSNQNSSQSISVRLPGNGTYPVNVSTSAIDNTILVGSGNYVALYSMDSWGGPLWYAPIPIPAQTGIITVLNTGTGYFAASMGMIYQIVPPADPNSQNATANNLFSVGSRVSANIINFGFDEGLGVILAASSVGAQQAIVAASPAPSKSVSLPCAGTVVNVLPLGNGIFALGGGGSVWVTDWLFKNPVKVASGFGKDAVRLASDPADPVHLYVGGVGVIGYVSLQQATPTPPPTLPWQRAGEQEAMSRRERMRRLRARMKQHADKETISPEERDAAIRAYWTPERKAAARRFANPQPADASAAPVPASLMGGLPYSMTGVVYATLDGVDWQTTGFVLGRETVGTAAHALYSDGYAENISFELGGTTYTGAGTPAVAEPWMDNHDPGYDFGIFQVNSPIAGSNAALAIQASPPPLNASVTSVGYPTSTDPLALWQCTGNIVSNDGTMVTMQNTLGAGADGGPWIVPASPGNLVGVNSQLVLDTWTSSAFGQWALDLYYASGQTFTESPNLSLKGLPYLPIAVMSGNAFFAANSTLYISPATAQGFASPASCALSCDGNMNGDLRIVTNPNGAAAGYVYVAGDGCIVMVDPSQTPPAQVASNNLPGSGFNLVSATYVPPQSENDTGYVVAVTNTYAYLMTAQLLTVGSPAGLGSNFTSNPQVCSDGTNAYFGGNGWLGALAFDNWNGGLLLNMEIADVDSCGTTNVLAAGGYLYAADCGTVIQVEPASGTVVQSGIAWPNNEIRMTTDGYYIYAAGSGNVAMLDPNNFTNPIWNQAPGELGSASPTSILASQGLVMVAANGLLVQLDQGGNAAFAAEYNIRNNGTVLDYQMAMDPSDPFAIYLGVPAFNSSANAVALRMQILNNQTTPY